MSYPGLSKEGAEKLFSQYLKKDLFENFEQLEEVKSGGDFDKNLISPLLHEFLGKLTEYKDKKIPVAKFDAWASIKLYERWKLPLNIAGDHDFWRWVTFSDEGLGLMVIDLRFGRETHSEWKIKAADQYENYGFMSLKSSYFAYLWIRSNALNDGTSYGEELQYFGEYTDLWRDGVVIYQKGSCKEFIIAYLEFIKKNNIKGDNQRALSKAVNRHQSMCAFELLSRDEALNFITEIWHNLKTP